MFVPSCLLWAAAYHKSAAFCFNYSFGSKNKCMCIITNRKKKYRLKIKVHPEPIPITQALLFAVFSSACCSHQRSYRTREGESTHKASRPQSSIVCAFSVKNSKRQCVDLQADQDRECAAHLTSCPRWLRGPWAQGAGRGHVVGFSPTHPSLFFTEYHLYPYHRADNPLPVLPQTQWKVNWMFYALAISKKWKARRFQPYFNNQCIHFYLLTDTCTNFLNCSPRFFSDLSALSADEEGWLQMRKD